MKRKIISLLLAAAMTVGLTTLPLKAEEIIESSEVYDSIIEEVTGDFSDEITLKDFLEEEGIVNENSDVNSVVEETISSDTESEFVTVVDVSADNGYTLTAEQKELKAELADKLDETFGINGDVSTESIIRGEDVSATAKAGESYVKNEIVYLTDAEEDAKRVANLFGGTLDSYAYKVAVIKLPAGISTYKAVCMSADPDTNIPMVCPNSYRYKADAKSTISAKLDPYLKKSAGSKYQWHIDYVGAQQAWEMGYTGAGVKVAVLDTGVERAHIDLKKNTTVGRNFYNNRKGKKYSHDYDGHGTHVAGIICADNNGKLGTGIAPDAKVTGFNVLGKNGGEVADELRALNYVLEDGSYDIINMSLGSTDYDENEKIVLENVKNAGIAVFAAAGNDDTSTPEYPASYKSVTSIASIDWNGYRSEFSNYGSEVVLSFPGGNIYSTNKKNLSGYIKESGTSMACPAAAGTAAVILSARQDLLNNKSASSVDQLISIMKSAAIKERGNDGKYIGVGTTYLPKALGNFTPISSVNYNIPEEIYSGDSFKIEPDISPANATTTGFRYVVSEDDKGYISVKGNKVTVSRKAPEDDYTIFAYSDDHSIYAEKITISVIE